MCGRRLRRSDRQRLDDGQINRRDRPFDKATLHNVLTNVTYIGKIRYKNEVYEHEAIVPDDLFQRVQAVLAKNRRCGGAEVHTKHGAPLKGLLRCANCNCATGHTYTTKRQRRYQYYRCTGDQKLGSDTCPTGSIPAVEIERFVVVQIRAIGRDPALVAETIAQAR